MNCCFCFRQKPSNDESNMSKGKALVQELIKTKKVLMISKEYCPFCVKAKDALKNYKVFLHGGRVQWTKSYFFLLKFNIRYNKLAVIIFSPKIFNLQLG